MQLEMHLGASQDICKHLASQIFSVTERSIGLITSTNLDIGWKHSNVPFKTTQKRAMVEKRRHQVRVDSAAAGVIPVDDGHSWRKYGQKEILGAKHPRAYYRCTHRHSQGCTATKQVQRTDEDPALFDVTYYGSHTCNRTTDTAAGQATQLPEHNPHNAHSLLPNLSAGFTVKTESLAAATEPQCWEVTTPLCISSMPESTAPERSLMISAPSTSENWAVSPSTSDSNHVVSLPPFEAATEHATWRDQSELQEVVPAFVTANAPVSAADIIDDFVDMDISSFFM
ncbi:EcWRKY-44, partial [Eragrostis curvula]